MSDKLTVNNLLCNIRESIYDSSALKVDHSIYKHITIEMISKFFEAYKKRYHSGLFKLPNPDNEPKLHNIFVEIVIDNVFLFIKTYNDEIYITYEVDAFINTYDDKL